MKAQNQSWRAHQHLCHSHMLQKIVVGLLVSEVS